MGGFVDDHVAIMGDWMAPSPSPRSYFSSMMNDNASENSSWAPFPGPQEHNSSGNADQNNPSVVGDNASNSNALFEPKMSTRGGLMERIAARAGFNAPRLNTESIRPNDLSKSQEVQSPYLTIPPGLSPTSLLDSPVFLTNSLVLPSPTTGKFSFVQNGNNRNSMLMTDNTIKGKENIFEDSSSFAFKPIADSGSIPYFNAANEVHAPSGFAPQPFPNLGVSANSNTSFLHRTIDPPKSQTFSNSNAEKNRCSNLSPEQTYSSVSLTDNSPPLDEPPEDDGDRRSGGDPNLGGAQADDGYNWRKYGQKQVKGSEYPRSYYKCTHPSCPVKKKVERSHEGHITEIIYKGAHNHPKPPPNRRSSLGSSNALESEQQNGTAANGDMIWSNMQNNLEATSLAHLAQDYGNGATLQAQNGGAQYESGEGVDASSTFSNDEDDEDHATHGSVLLGYDGEGDESESKRRRIENYAAEMSGATRAIREPRVVVQTTSEVDILDDGYRWRKYGQKVVKGNPNPRSYYKCTSAGCNVRKHVERASHDLKSVITTYEGKHNHDVPAARNSSHVNSGPTQQSAASSHIHRPEPSQMHSNAARFERPPLGSYGLPGRPQMGPGYGFGMNQAGLASLGLAGLGHSHNPYLGHPPRPMNGMGFMMPKQEPKLEPVTDSSLNSSDGSSVYHQLMSRLPLGP